MNDASAVNPADDRLLRQSLDELMRRTRFPVVFGGFAHEQRISISHLIGNERNSLRGLLVSEGSGLGGRVLAEARPRLTANYASSRAITHDYDRAVLTEGITTLLAIPVVASGHVLGVLYGGLRSHSTIGGVSIEPATMVAKELAIRLERRRRGEADTHLDASTPRRVAPADSPVSEPSPTFTPAQTEELRSIYAEMRRISAQLHDPTVRSELELVERRLIGMAQVDDEPEQPDERAVAALLTARESDVLSQVALGHTNAAVAISLGLTESTVKSYLNQAMRKLGASTRFEALAIARRNHLLV
ncbi:LuxR C-terminal-related transcriptional regulator [Herbiconiux ginsengi]|nr:LuxR C-terminal-related transcriptional regulator [Herbiconiux ginsengi]